MPLRPGPPSPAPAHGGGADLARVRHPALPGAAPRGSLSVCRGAAEEPATRAGGEHTT